VGTILRKYSGNLTPLTSEKVMKLSDERKTQIDRKLAGPLVGHVTTIEESIIADYHLLRDLIGFKGDQANRRKSIHEEIHTLSSESTNFPKIDSLKELVEIDSESSFEELTSIFLNVWIDTFQWAYSNKTKVEKEELTTLVGQIQRIASMFSTDLQSDEFLIHGHGHINHVDHTNRMVDTGCWIEDKASFVSVIDGVVESSRWPKR